MSTRYVWDIYDLAKEPAENESGVLVESIAWNNSEDYIALPIVSYTFENGEYKPTVAGSPLTYNQLLSGVSAITYPYLAIASFSGTNYPASFKKIYKAVPLGDYKQRTVWYCRRDSTVSPYAQEQTGRLITTDSNYIEQGKITDSNLPSYANPFNSLTVKYVTTDEKGDTKIGIVSNASSTAYPQDGVSGSSWYVYKGSDSIDPLSVTYNTDRPERGQAVTVTVEPRPTEETAPHWVSSSLPAAGRWTGIAHGGGWFVAVGIVTEGETAKSGVARSSDGGKTWSSVSQQVFVSPDAVAYGGGKFVMTGNGDAGYSTDSGGTWTASSSFPNGQWANACYGNGKFVAVDSYRSKAMYSSDGNVWTEVSIPGNHGWYGVTYGNGKFVAVGDRYVAYSADAISWFSLSVETPSSAPFLRSVAFGGGMFVAVGSAGETVHSVDAQNWTEVATPYSLNFKGIAYGNGKFIAVGSEQYSGSTAVSVCSADAETWGTMTMPTSGIWNAIAYGDGSFAAITSAAVNATGSSAAAYLLDEVDAEYTVSYLYQYSTNSGVSWVTVGTATADTQMEITIPDGAEQFMARVRAQDDIGFTSADYVSGANVDVQTMRLWAGVNGVAKEGRKLWVGVNGTARPVVRGWVGDESGTARRWF